MATGTKKGLYKTVIVIWSPSDENPSAKELSTLARHAESEACYCSKCESKFVEKPKEDPDWDGTEFFNEGEEEDG